MSVTSTDDLLDVVSQTLETMAHISARPLSHAPVLPRDLLHLRLQCRGNAAGVFSLIGSLSLGAALAANALAVLPRSQIAQDHALEALGELGTVAFALCLERSLGAARQQQRIIGPSIHCVHDQRQWLERTRRERMSLFDAGGNVLAISYRLSA